MEFLDRIKQNETEPKTDVFFEEKRQLKESQITPRSRIFRKGDLVSLSHNTTEPPVVVQKVKKNKRVVYVKKYNRAA